MYKKRDLQKELEKIWQQPGPDYYQKGIKKNLLQRIWHQGKLNTVLELIKENKASPKKILDVGSASGWFLQQIKKRYLKAECVGVDVYKEAIKYGNKKYPQLNLLYADAHNLPFDDDTFDLVICAEVLEHVLEPEKVVAEIKRVLTKKGSAIIEMDSGNLLFRLIWYWWTNVRHGVWKNSHLHLFNVNKLKKTIEDGGLRILQKKTFNFSMAVVFVTKE